MEIINKIYFSIFVFSLIVFVDLMVKFKRPLILKFYLGLLALCGGLNALLFTISLDSSLFLFITSMFKGVISFCIINVFTILYYPKLQNWVNGLGVVYIIYEILLYQYIHQNPTLFVDLPQRALMMMMKSKVALPLYLNLYRIPLTIIFLFAMAYTSTAVLFKQEHQNIYFDKIKTWSKLLVSFVTLMVVLFAPMSFVQMPELFSYMASILSFVLIELFVFYRPAFLNRSALKISFGNSFNRDSEYAISELEFINEFYTKLYFVQNDASLENLAKSLNISSNDLYKFIYYKYSMTFNDLVNKNRVDYFIDIIHNPKYLNYTIDALAKEAGFSSRQHLYKPFKKFHGGNPSDIMDAIAV
jgi:AraC-like DNA-binding protein